MRIAEKGGFDEKEKVTTNEYRGLGCRMPKNTSRKDEKMTGIMKLCRKNEDSMGVRVVSEK